MYRIIYILFKHVKFQHNNTVKYNSLYSVCVAVSRGLNNLNYHYLKWLRSEIVCIFLRKSTKNWNTVVYRFSISYLVLELQNFEDAKIKAKSTDTKHAILVTSHTLNKYSLDSQPYED